MKMIITVMVPDYVLGAVGSLEAYQDAVQDAVWAVTKRGDPTEVIVKSISVRPNMTENSDSILSLVGDICNLSGYYPRELKEAGK
jgi:ADP-ribosylglycohydrolase